MTSKVNIYFKGYKTKSNKDSDLRWYSHDKSKRLYVSKKLVGQYIQARGRADDDGTIIIEVTKSCDGALRVNSQHFISLNRLTDGDFKVMSSKALVYGTKAKQIINK